MLLDRNSIDDARKASMVKVWICEIVSIVIVSLLGSGLSNGLALSD